MCIDVVFPYYMIFLLLSMEHYMTSSFLQFQNLFKSTSPKLLSLQEYNSMIEENLNIIEVFEIDWILQYKFYQCEKE